ncbi:MAG: hypothetical protein ACLFT4_06925, partial [Bacteroidales bacterium]
MTPVEFHYSMEAHSIYENEQFKVKMEVARFLATHVWNSAGKSLKKKEFNPRKLIPFDWDKPIIREKQTMEEMKSVMFGLVDQTKNQK